MKGDSCQRDPTRGLNINRGRRAKSEGKINYPNQKTKIQGVAGVIVARDFFHDFAYFMSFIINYSDLSYKKLLFSLKL